MSRVQYPHRKPAAPWQVPRQVPWQVLWQVPWQVEGSGRGPLLGPWAWVELVGVPLRGPHGGWRTTGCWVRWEDTVQGAWRWSWHALHTAAPYADAVARSVL